jgi:membrane protein required for colicin V production
MDLGLTWFDFAALVVLGLSGVMAFARGLIREVFSIIAFIGAVIAAVFFSGMLRPLVESFTPISGWPASVLAGLLVFLIVFIVITVITSTVAKQAHQSTEIGSFDRAAGLAFGILRGVVVVALFVLFMRQTGVEDPTEPVDPMQDSIRGARTYPIYDGVASALEAILPQARQRAHDIIDRRQGESAPIPPAEPESGAETPPN